MRRSATGELRCEVLGVRELRFDDGSPVRAASAVAGLGDGWLVAQDDATHAAWVRPGGTSRLRLLAPIGGHDLFDEGSGTKHHKPDLEAACRVRTAQGPGVVLLGSGSTPARMRGVLVIEADGAVRSSDLAPLYSQVAAALRVDPQDLNLEGAVEVPGALRWFQRGIPTRGVAPGSVDVDLQGLLRALDGMGADVDVGRPRTYRLGELGGQPLTITDAVALADGTVLVSAAAELAPNAVDDGEVLGSALSVLDGAEAVSTALVDGPGGTPVKVEGLAVITTDATATTLLAVTDADDPDSPSLALTLALHG